MPTHGLVADQRLGRRPVLATDQPLQRVLVEPDAGQAQVRGMVAGAQRDGELTAEAGERVGFALGRRGVDEPRAADGAAAGASRHVRERGADELHRGRARQRHAVGERAGELEGPRPRGGQDDRHEAPGRSQPAVVDAEPLALVRDGVAAQQRADDVHRLPQRAERPLRLDAGVGEIVGRAGADAEPHAPRRQLVERGGRHRHVHGMHGVGAHGQQRHPHARGRAEHDGGDGERVAQEQMARHPHGVGAGFLGRARLLAQHRQRIAPVEGDAERGSDRHRSFVAQARRLDNLPARGHDATRP